jgi:hypothetical protein
MSGRNALVYSCRVQLGVEIQESCKLSGRYTVRMDLEREAKGVLQRLRNDYAASLRACFWARRLQRATIRRR